jgi:hypothetical protein
MLPMAFLLTAIFEHKPSASHFSHGALEPSSALEKLSTSWLNALALISRCGELRGTRNSTW